MANRLADLTFDDWQVEALREKKRLQSCADFLRGAAPKPPPLVHGFLPEQTLILVSAEPYTGKSLFCLDLALALATTAPVLTRYAPAGRKTVLFCGQDSPNWDYAEQLRKLARGRGLLPAAADDIPLDLWLNEGWDLTTPDFLGSLEEWQHAHPVDVVIFDTLAAFHSADENSSREMGAIMTILKRLRDRFRWTIIATHHTAKPTPGDEERSLNYRARGSSVIAGSIDVHLSLRRLKDDNIAVRMPKGRGADPIDRKLAFAIREREEVDGTQHVSLIIPNLVDTLPDLVEGLLRGQPMTRAELLVRSKQALPTLRASALDNCLALMKREGRLDNPQRGIWICCATPSKRPAPTMVSTTPSPSIVPSAVGVATSASRRTIPGSKKTTTPSPPTSTAG